MVTPLNTITDKLQCTVTLLSMMLQFVIKHDQAIQLLLLHSIIKSGSIYDIYVDRKSYSSCLNCDTLLPSVHQQVANDLYFIIPAL